jgi:dTDP-4-dehydrorhamnose 3,5-epimerase
MGQINNQIISGVTISDLRIIPDKRGAVMHMMRNDSPVYDNFGEIYFSKVHFGFIKAWKQHKEMTLNLAVPVGKIKLVLFDNRLLSPTKGFINELYLSEENYQLISIPPMIWTGFVGLSTETALIANLASIPHQPEEVNKLELSNTIIPYTW